MSRKTPLMLAPTLEEVKLAAAKVGLSDHEAQKFFHYYESNGWRVGKVRMVSFMNALAGWKLRWEERSNGASSPAQLILKQKELDRVERAIEAVKRLGTVHPFGVVYTEEQRMELGALKARRKELLGSLGYAV